MATSTRIAHPPEQRALSHSLPLVRPLPTKYTPEYCFERLSRMRHCVWLDSATNYKGLGRYSYLAAEPFTTLRLDRPGIDALVQISSILARYHSDRVSYLPPLQGGWIGWFGYEMGRSFETIPRAQHNDFQLPVAALGMYDVVLAWDHETGQGWIVSQGWPETGERRHRYAYRRLNHFLRHLESPLEQLGPDLSDPYHPLAESRLAPQFQTRWSDRWTSNFAAQDYRDAVQKCIDYIYAGDVFQVNLSQRLLRKSFCPPARLYRQLRSLNPAPFSGYADFGRVQVISSSPERFLQVTDRRIEARPIKGTRPRLSDPTADAGMGELLEASEKDRSENVMIVDLMRNDLSRVAEDDSVKVTSLCGLERYAYVWHLVSVIEARLREGLKAPDVLQATFPGGSITGAPKIRAMEIIAELEPTVRGPYCGSLGYISFAGEMDLSILIRTITACHGWWQLPVGGGIVANSDPGLEEQETWHKAEGVLRAIDSLENLHDDIGQ